MRDGTDIHGPAFVFGLCIHQYPTWGVTQMPTVVMVPLDGSPAAESALPWAVHLANKSRGTIKLLGVHAPPAVLLDGETLVGSVVPDESIRRQETDYFADVQARLKPAGVEISADLLDGGVVSSLVDYARTQNPTWIVMMAHARGPVARFFLGETAAEFVRESPCPVLLVHPASGAIDLTAVPDVRHVLVPLDGSSLAEHMLTPAIDFARAMGVDLTLLTALAGVPDPLEAERYLGQKAERLRAGGANVNVRIVPEGSAADVIVAEAESNPGTVVALATHGRGGLSKLVWGSVADHVVRHTHAPVLILKSTEK